MDVVEHKGKELFLKYGIKTPSGVLIEQSKDLEKIESYPAVLKAQVHFGDRKKHGGIKIVNNRGEAETCVSDVLEKELRGETVESLLAEELINFEDEYYVSLSYSSEFRGPALLVSSEGGSGIAKAHTAPVLILEGFKKGEHNAFYRAAGIKEEHHAELDDVISNLWQLFIEEYATLAEVNPLFKTKDGLVAGDAKIILDDEKYDPGKQRFVEMDGNIAILASGGGASMINIDALERAGGKPANYTEYSGNPPREKVATLTRKVLEKEGIKACWVVGGTANFTDIFETLSGFMDGLKSLSPKPTYPIVIRREGPRRAEAFEMLEKEAKEHGFDVHLFDGSTSMESTAAYLVNLLK